MADDKLTYSIEVDDNATPKLKKVGQSFKAVDDSSKKMSATMVAQGVIIAGAAKMIATKIIAIGKATIDEADSFGEFGRSIGVTTKEVAGLDRTFRLGGSSTEGMKAAMFALSAALDPEKITKQRKAVEDLGVSVMNEDGTYKTHLQLLGDIADAYKGEESASRRAALSRRIFGGESQKMNDVLEQGGAAMREQIKLFGNASGYTEELTDGMANFNDTLTKVDVVLKGILAAIGNGYIFAGAIDYIKELSDEWVKFLAELPDDHRIEKASRDLERLNDVQERYTKMLSRSALYKNYSGAIEEGRKMAGAAIADGVRVVEVQNAELLALDAAIKAMKAKGAASGELAAYEAEFARVSALKKNELEKEAQRTKAAEKALKDKADAQREANLADEESPAAQASEFTFKVTYDDSIKRERELEIERRDSAERINEEVREQEREKNEYLRQLAVERMTEFEREKSDIRAWYEEQKLTYGQSKELELTYQFKLEQAKEAERQREISHAEKMRDLDRQRFEDQQIIASATFDFLSTATAGYKSMAGVAKGIAIAEAWWNTYVAATKALDYGPIMGPIVASLMVAKGTAMVGKINAQKFAEGGIVGGSSYYGDRTPVLANSREMYLNTAQQADLFNFVSGRANMVDKLREKNVGGRTVTLNVNGMFLDQKTVRKISRELSLAESRA